MEAKKSKYAELDEAIVKSIRLSGKFNSSGLMFKPELRAIASKISVSPSRLIYRRLRPLRRAGRISYDRSAGAWSAA